MKKYVPYFIGAIALVVLIILVLNTPLPVNKTFDERITLRQKDKIPYGTYAAYSLLPALFPGAAISIDRKEPAYWQSLLPSAGNQAVFLVAKSFEPEENELQKLAEFVRNGNYVFIIANSLSFDATHYFGLSVGETLAYITQEDSLQVSLQRPPFTGSSRYSYPGKRFDTYFSAVDTARTIALGSDQWGRPNFIQLVAGEGKLFIHTAPLAFSNYFLLHKNNATYLSQVLSLIPPTVDKVLWNEYYLVKRKPTEEKEKGVLSVLWQYPSFRWALLTAIATLLLYTLMEMRRRQRMVPLMPKPVNDSLDFIRTMGRLYYDRKDHYNLATKMGVHFQEHLRSRYKMRPQPMDEGFIKELHAKSGYPVEELQRITAFIKYMETTATLTESELAHFYKLLETFYSKT